MVLCYIWLLSAVCFWIVGRLCVCCVCGRCAVWMISLVGLVMFGVSRCASLRFGGLLLRLLLGGFYVVVLICLLG